jgi:hypothetical protein
MVGDTVDAFSMGGGDVEGSGLRVWAEFPLAEFAGILFRKVVIGWYVGYKILRYLKAYMVQLVEHW